MTVAGTLTAGGLGAAGEPLRLKDPLAKLVEGCGRLEAGGATAAAPIQKVTRGLVASDIVALQHSNILLQSQIEAAFTTIINRLVGQRVTQTPVDGGLTRD